MEGTNDEKNLSKLSGDDLRWQTLTGKEGMARILGKVDDGVGVTLFFIHCDTAGSSFGPLFATPKTAWANYDQNGIDGLSAVIPAQSRELRVIRKSLAHGREFDPNGEIYGESLFGLATADRLVLPKGQYDQCVSFLRFDGVLHLAKNIDGGIDGDYDAPLCNERRDCSENDEHFALEEFFGKELDLCPHCVSKACGQ